MGRSYFFVTFVRSVSNLGAREGKGDQAMDWHFLTRMRGQDVPCSIAPPYILATLAAQGSAAQRSAAIRTLTESAAVRARRATLTHVLRESGPSPAEMGLTAGEHLTVYDVKHGGDTDLPGSQARADAGPPSGDDAVNQAFDGADRTYGFYKKVFSRQSVDGHSLGLVSSVHYKSDFDNALWNGSKMIYGDGSGHLFAVGALTKDIAVMAHELTHGVTQYTAGLSYHQQPGALNESISDVFGSLVKQFVLGQSADQADWLIGAGILGSALHGRALRSMAEPGTAYDGDPQPADMDGYVDLPDDDDPRHDHGGVHINSGIPNRAFYLVATSLGGNAWESAGQVWYNALTSRLQPDSDFVAAAHATIAAAGTRYGSDSTQQQAVQSAWQQVKVLP
jgi:Zn-dependent metalloprotease